MEFVNAVTTPVLQILVAILVALRNIMRKSKGHEHHIYSSCILKIQETKAASKVEAFSYALYNCSNLLVKNLAQCITTNNHTHHFIVLLLKQYFTSSQRAFNTNSKSNPYKLSAVHMGNRSPQQCEKGTFKRNSEDTSEAQMWGFCINGSLRLEVGTPSISRLSSRLQNHRVVKVGRDLLRLCTASTSLKAESTTAGVRGPYPARF